MAHSNWRESTDGDDSDDESAVARAFRELRQTWTLLMAEEFGIEINPNHADQWAALVILCLVGAWVAAQLFAMWYYGKSVVLFLALNYWIAMRYGYTNRKTEEESRRGDS